MSIQNVEGPMQAIADIRLRIEHGASVNEVNAAYESHEFPELEGVKAQMAMIKVVEKVGQSAVVQEVLEQECLGKDEVDLQNVGFKALITTLAKESFKVDEIITQFEPDDFEEDAVQGRLAQLVVEAQQLDVAEKIAQVQLSTADQVNITQVNFTKSNSVFQKKGILRRKQNKCGQTTIRPLPELFGHLKQYFLLS